MIQAGPERILLIEPSASGHHMTLYLRHVIKGLVDEGVAISLLTTREAAADPAYQLVAAELPESSNVHFFKAVPAPLRPAAGLLLMAQFSNWLRLRSAVQKVFASDPCDIIYISTIDWVGKAIETLGSPFGGTPFAALYMSPKHHRYAAGIGPKARFNSLYDKLFKRLLGFPTLRALLVVDELFFDFARGRYGKLALKVGFAPDFSSVDKTLSRRQARERLGIPSSAVVLLVYGSLTIRKGISELLYGCLEEAVPNNLIILMAGRASVEVTQLLNRPEYAELSRQGKIISRLEFHDTEGEHAVFAAADAVWVAYVDGFYGSSGVLHQAAAYGLPVLSGRKGLIGVLVTKYRLGLTFDPKDANEVQDALTRLSSGELLSACSMESQREFRETYSFGNYMEAVKRALGL